MRKDLLWALAFLFALLAVGLAAAGLVTAFTYNELTDSLVGGDAYNFQIRATRGVAMIGAGVISAVLSLIPAAAALAVRPPK